MKIKRKDLVLGNLLALAPTYLDSDKGLYFWMVGTMNQDKRATMIGPFNPPDSSVITSTWNSESFVAQGYFSITSSEEWKEEGEND